MLGRQVLAAEPLRRAFTSLPIIDVSALVNPSADAVSKAAVAQQLHSACKDVGFFYIKNHGIPPSITDGVLAEARRWFALPQAEKARAALRSDTAFRGYQSLGDNVTRYEGGFQRDWHEAIDLYREVDDAFLRAEGGRLGSSPVHGVNQWPTQLPSFDAALRTYIASCLKLGASLMRGIALGLGEKEDYFERPEAGGTSPETSYWTARVIHYPPLAEGTAHQGQGQIDDAAARALAGEEVQRSVQLSCGEHADYGLLTLVNQEPHITALQVKNANGQWINADPIPGTFVCNIGEMFRYWTNGVYTPTYHRVINADPSRSRVSIPFFYEPSFEAVAKPLPGFSATANGANYQPMRFGTYLESKVLTNFELEPSASVVAQP